MKGKWEKISPGDITGFGGNCFRIKVPGGWLVRSDYCGGIGKGAFVAHIFIKDPNHEWDIEE